MSEVDPAWLSRGPMLPTAEQPPTPDGWATEFKWDGVRCLLVVNPGDTRLISRNGKNITRAYPELAAVGDMVPRRVVLDGEVIATGAGGKPDFARLQRRMHRDRPDSALLRTVPVSLIAFDVLLDGDAELLDVPYLRRRERLTALDLTDPVHVPEHVTDVSPADMLEVAAEHDLEGVVAKRVDSRYEPGRRTRDWIKTAIRHTVSTVVGGWVPGSGKHSSVMGSLLVGIHDEAGRLRYCGHVGTGFSDRDRAEFRRTLEELAVPDSPFAEPVPREFARAAHWARPVIVAEVEFRQWTTDGRLRQPSFRGVRDDIAPEDATVRQRG